PAEDLGRDEPGHLDAGCVAGLGDDLGPAQHRLRRHAGPGRTLAADEPALDERHLRLPLATAEGAHAMLARPPPAEKDDLQTTYSSRFAFRNAVATAAGDCLSTTTALFIATIASCVSFPDSALTVSANFEPACWATDVFTIGTTFWKPVTCFGSASTVYFEFLPSGGSVEETSAACPFPWSGGG